ncbi:aquaporin-11 [Trichomycterus rosablanca]|uniref:aquaporin-11 n=1 Tax=Trichomycterus rosablanca TaxID=2290929 RepID=UPI002F353FF2
MADVAVALAVLAVIVLICEIVRKRAAQCGVHLSELVSTVQLCACAHELKLLSEREPGIALTLTYVISVVHALTFRGAHANPSGTLERWFAGSLSGAGALSRCACQLAAAAGAGALMRRAWALGLSDLHAHHALSGFRCTSPIENVSVLVAAAVELACAFTVHAAATLTRGLDEKLRVHAVAGVITLVVYAGGSITGAVFNPALAFTSQFPCTGSTFVENCLVYWVGPVLGMVCSVLLFDKILPAFTAKSTTQEDQNIDTIKRKKWN